MNISVNGEHLSSILTVQKKIIRCRTDSTYQPSQQNRSVRVLCYIYIARVTNFPDIGQKQEEGEEEEAEEEEEEEEEEEAEKQEEEEEEEEGGEKKKIDR